MHLFFLSQLSVETCTASVNINDDIIYVISASNEL